MIIQKRRALPNSSENLQVQMHEFQLAILLFFLPGLQEMFCNIRLSNFSHSNLVGKELQPEIQSKIKANIFFN